MSVRNNRFYLLIGVGLLARATDLPVFAQLNRQATRNDSLRSTASDSLRYLGPYVPSHRPTFRLQDRYGDPFSTYTTQSPLYLKDPASIKLDVEIDTGLNYTLHEKIGNVSFRPVTMMTFEEFSRHQERQLLRSYWKSRSQALDGESAVSTRGGNPKIYISPVLDRVFGGSYVELIPRGFVTLDFGGAWQKIDNPSIPIRQQKNGGFEFDQQINMSVVGKIGEKLAVTTNFDNNNSFDFQNNLKVEYTGFKEDILKKLEIGNVSLPLTNSLIQGAQNLFGVKTQMQFGKMFITAIASTQRGKAESIRIPGGGSGQGRPFEMISSGYDENRHFFLGHFFADNFERWLSTLPQITSGVNITRVEVYLLNRQNDTQTLRNVVGFMDMAEPRNIYRTSLITPSGLTQANSNDANDLFSVISGVPLAADSINGFLQALGFVNGTDYEKITGARKLATTEYMVNRELGYITLTRKLQNDEAIGIAYEYTYNGRVYKVGELSEDYSNRGDEEAILLKMLRPRKIAIRDDQNRRIPTWDLMMKNIYALNVSQLNQEGFQLRIIYRDDRTGIDNPQLQDGTYSRNRQLVQVFGLDKLNPNNDPQPDGNFDYVPGVTIVPEQGLIILPYLKPFDTALRNLFKDEPNKDALQQKYLYDTLYKSTRTDAEQVSTKNKFYFVGQFQSGSSKEILIPGFNIAQGSVKVYAGGVPLREGTDYQVDYTFGKVTILNEGILNSGKELSVNYEQNDPFAFQTRTLLGTRLDYRVSEDISVGSTLLYYNERPLISRNLLGTEPARNLQYGVDLNLRKKSRILTQIVDALPFLNTKETSSLNLNAEFAQLIPGTSNQVEGEGTSYIDDFENSATPFSLMNPVGWKLASTPKTDDNRYDPSGGANNDVRAGYNRARVAWYQVDNLFYRKSSSNKPDNITPADLENHYVRAVLPQEVFPYRDPYVGNFYEPVLDIAYYPTERGPYNYNPDLANGLLKNPTSNWAGITSAIRTEVDFDKANIEYVEFWLMDPFIPGKNGEIDDGVNPPQNNTSGGRLSLHLGSISEDLMRDGLHAFENGLPADGDLSAGSVTQNNWGYVTQQQYLTNAFDNLTSSRANQDVGLDGVPTEKELTTFQDFVNAVPVSSRPAAEADPSADDFLYFLGSDFDAADAKVLERYKAFNGLEGNSPVLTGDEDFTPSGSTIPENEDLNVDNTLTDVEEYYAYHMDIQPTTLDVGQKFVVDKITNTINGDAVTWYLFRIPVRQFDEKVGNISDFKSIRYARLILSNFQQPAVLRFINFRSVGSRWRRYVATLEDSKFGEPLEPNYDNFSVSVVSIEENGQGSSTKPPYAVPPGLNRDRDNTSTVQRRLNEQSLQVCVEGLQDGDGRAAFKNVGMDFFFYGKVEMFFHAHGTAQDDQLVGFVRLGTDPDQNFYEIEVPLTVTPPFVGNPDDDAVRELVWPDANRIDLALEELYALKVRRDREQFPLLQPYPLAGPHTVGNQGLRIVGRPDLSAVKVIMIGVRNPVTTDKLPADVCIWANELRLTDFNRKSGWAGNAVLNARLADFANLTGSVKHVTFGYGDVQSKINERSRDEVSNYDISANVNVEKLLPEKAGLKIPMFISYERTTIRPQYDPANPDIPLSATLKSFQTDEERDAYEEITIDQTTRKSLNFTNVKKVKLDPQAKAHIYDVENFSFTYAFSEASRSNFNMRENLIRSYRGGVAYTYNSKATGIEPFKSSDGLKSPWLKLIKDFNFNLLPASFSVRLDLDRSLNKTLYRNSVNSLTDTANFLKYFRMDRVYNLRWNLAKSLTLEYSARANALIDEPAGDPEGGQGITRDEYRDSVKVNLKKFGRMKNFGQNITLNYTVPFDKLPLTDWLGAEYRHQLSYDWRAGPINQADSLRFGNITQNAKDQALTGRVDMMKLYNKIGLLKRVNQPPKPASTRPAAPGAKPDTVKAPAEPGKAVKGVLKLLMSVRNINGTYNVGSGTILPGYLPTPWLFGMDKNWEAPGWPFIFGSQDPNIRFKAAEKGWLTRATALTTPFSQVENRDLTLRAAVEPASDLKIQLDAKKTSTSAYQEIFRFDETVDEYASLSPSRSGSYKVSIISIGTALKRDNSKIESSVFREFEQNLDIVQSRFSSLVGGGYETKSQDVVIPAFLAAYSGKDANSVSLSPFPSLPVPNWRVDYAGLSKVSWLKDVFQSITINHAYSSTYSVVNFSNSLEYDDLNLFEIDQSVEDYNRTVFGTELNNDGEIIPVYIIGQVMISEQFAPLFGINLRTKKRLSGRFEYKTKRDLALNISNAQVTEMNSKDVTLEMGYTKNNMKLPFKSQGRTIVLKNDVTFRLTMSVADNVIIQRKIDEVNTVTNGNLNFQLRPNVSYVVNQKLNIQLYFERNINDPQVSNSYRRATTKFGTKILFSLAQ